MKLRKTGLGLILITMFSLLFIQQALAADINGIKNYADAEIAIEHLRKQKNTNWDEITKQYKITEPIVKITDEKWRTDYISEINEALKKCSAGNLVKVNQQILAKGLQHVTVLNITDLLNKIGTDPLAGEKIAAFFEGIRPTFVRRDKDFFNSKKNLEKAADDALAALLDSQAADLLTARRALEDAIARTYAMCVLFEVMEIEKLRDTSPSKCDVKKMEAVVFYRIIQPRIKKRNPKADEVITNIINGSYNTMDAGVLKNYLETGLRGVKLF